MLTIQKIDTENKAHVKRFVKYPHRLYKDCPQWVPLLDIDAYTYLNRKKHPFHEHSDVGFFLAELFSWRSAMERMLGESR